MKAEAPADWDYADDSKGYTAARKMAPAFVIEDGPHHHRIGFIDAGL